MHRAERHAAVVRRARACRARAAREDPRESGLFAFATKRSNRLKILWFDRNGYCLLYKRLHPALFRLPSDGGASAVQIDSTALGTLLAGVDRPPRRGEDADERRFGTPQESAPYSALDTNGRVLQGRSVVAHAAQSLGDHLAEISAEWLREHVTRLETERDVQKPTMCTIFRIWRVVVARVNGSPSEPNS